MSGDGPEAAKSALSGGTLGSVGSYQLVEKMPQRREVSTYLARQKGPGGFERWCTLKMAKRSSATTDARAAEAISREAKVMMRLDHPSIVRFHDFFEHDDNLVLVLEHFSGLTLERFVELSARSGARVDDRITWNVALSLFDALAHAHGLVDQAGQPAPILHRDVRPANVLLASDGRVRLTGFAFAQDVDADESTACAAVYTAPSYVAPEVVRAKEATDRTDAFAAALVVWELLTGRSGTQVGLTDFELLKHLSNRALEPLRTARADLPALVTTALDQCLVADPAERRIGCGEVAGCIRAGLEPGDVAGALREAVAALGPAVEKLAGGKAAAPPSSRRMTSEIADVPPRPEAVTIPDASQMAQVDETKPSKLQVPAVLMPPVTEPRRIELSEQGRSADEEETVADPPTPAAQPIQDLPPPAPPVHEAVRASGELRGAMPEAPTAAGVSDAAAAALDDDLAEMQAFHARRRRLRLALIGVPLVLTIVALGFAFAGAECTGTDSSDVQPAVPTTTQPPATAAASPAAALPEAAPPEPPKAAISAPVASAIPASQALLIVQGPPEGEVYVMGRSVGVTGEPILTECGQRFVRVGTRFGPGGLSSVRWLAEGRSVRLRCGEKTVVSLKE